MAIKSNKKNPIVKDLFTKKYKPKIVKPKKGKGSFKRKKWSLIINLNLFSYIYIKTYDYPFFIRIIS